MKNEAFNVLLVVVLVLAALFGCMGMAQAQVLITGDPEIQIQYPVYLPMVSLSTQPPIGVMTCKVTHTYPDGSWVETCTESVGENRIRICTVHWIAEGDTWRVLEHSCIIVNGGN